MTALVWDQTEARRYEAGVSHGVFYPQSEDPGVPWNGLISVDEGVVGGEQSIIYLDGIKYLDTVSNTDYQASINAFSAPKEFNSCNGERSIVPGFRLTKQPKSRFDFSYQTPFGDGYKIHLVYNVLASQATKGHTSIGGVVDPSVLTWTFDATPVALPGFRPAAHYLIDSTKADPEVLTELEGILYGTESFDPAFPSIESLVALFASDIP